MNVKDSGERRGFDTGAVRDMAEGKGRCDLLPACALLRLAKLYEAGGKKYDDRNWEKGIPISVMIDSGMRHLLKYLDGQTDEDHLCAAAWNIMGAMWMEEKRPDLQNLPSRKLDKDISMVMKANPGLLKKHTHDDMIDALTYAVENNKVKFEFEGGLLNGDIRRND